MMRSANTNASANASLPLVSANASLPLRSANASVAGAEEGDGTSHGMTFVCQCATCHTRDGEWV